MAAGLNRGSPRRPLRIVVVGAGFAGIGAAIELVRAGHDDVVVLEAADDLGGTWRDNTYPGCACDIPSHLYSFSFEPNPDWTRGYPSQPEIQAYLQRTTDRHDVRRRIRFSTLVTQLVWDDDDATWTVHTAGGEVLVADVVVNGTGPLSRPHVPDLPGLDDFEGTVFHSARWDHGHDLAGERVAVVGTGASSVQFVPQIAPWAGHTTVFQRTAPWVIGREDRTVPRWKRRLYRQFPALQRLHRWRIYLRQELLVLAFLGHPRVTQRVAAMGEEHIDAAVDDPTLRAAVTPTITPGCKRLLISDDWYPTLTRPDVELVTEPIERLTPSGVRTADGVVHRADTVILGTGFAATDFLAPMRVVGRGGVELSEAWRDGAATHLGITVAGFPNFFLLAGPSTGLGHNSIVFMIEAQLHHVRGALDHLRRVQADVVEVRADVQADAYADVQRRMRGTVWASGCHSWYRSADGRVDTLWPGSTVSYWWRTRRFDSAAHLVRRVDRRGDPARATDSEHVARGG